MGPCFSSLGVCYMDDVTWTGPDVWGFFLLLGWEWGEEHYSDVSMDTVHKDKTIYKNVYDIYFIYLFISK